MNGMMAIRFMSFTKDRNIYFRLYFADTLESDDSLPERGAEQLECTRSLNQLFPIVMTGFVLVSGWFRCLAEPSSLSELKI